MLRRIADATLIRALRYVVGRSIVRPSIFDELDRITIKDCASYIYDHMGNALSFPKREPLWAHALSKRQPGMIAEFGVWNGESINRFAEMMPNETLYGFDSFEGLKEDWRGHSLAKGAFSRGGSLPAVRPNVRLIKGWFNDTLPRFLADHPEPFGFIHIDGDTYEAAKAVFDVAAGRIRPGTVIVFDEYLGYRGWRHGEFKAWQECAAKHGMAYSYLGFSWPQVSVIVTPTLSR